MLRRVVVVWAVCALGLWATACSQKSPASQISQLTSLGWTCVDNMTSCAPVDTSWSCDSTGTVCVNNGDAALPTSTDEWVCQQNGTDPGVSCASETATVPVDQQPPVEGIQCEPPYCSFPSDAAVAGTSSGGSTSESSSPGKSSTARGHAGSASSNSGQSGNSPYYGDLIPGWQCAATAASNGVDTAGSTCQTSCACVPPSQGDTWRCKKVGYKLVCRDQNKPVPGSTGNEDSGCWFTGGGTIGKGDTRDSFGGNAMTVKDGTIRGEWEHVDHMEVSGKTTNGQNLFHGQVQYIVCRHYAELNGPDVPKAEPNFVNFGGTGKFNGVDGYSFDVKAFDHAEGGRLHDRYTITVKDAKGNVMLEADGKSTRDLVPGGCPEDASLQSDPSLAWVAEMGCVSGGNLQIHPSNAGHPYTTATTN